MRGQATLSVTASDTNGSGVATVSLYIDGLLSGTQTSGIAGTYTFPVDTTKLSDGDHAITAVITDNAGNTFPTPNVTARVNNAAPTVTISNPANGALLGSTSDASVKAVPNDTTPGDTVALEYSVDGSAFNATAPTLPKTDGNHTVTVRATDKAGNTGTATSTYTYDGTAPTVQITSLTQGQMFTSTPVTISLIGQDSGTGVASIKVYANDGSTDELIGTLGGNGSVTWYPRKTDGTPYTIRAAATDRAGNASADATVTGVKVKTASTVQVTAGPAITPPNADPKGSTYTSNGRTYVRGPLVISAAATTDAPSMTQAELQADGQTLLTTTTATGNPTFTFDFDNLNEGLRDIGVRFTDSLGTVGVTKTTVYVDKTAPIINWNAPLNGSLSSTPVTLNATATDSASGVNGNVTYTENGQPVTMSDGQHTVTATATDNVGNVAARNVTFTIDSTAPDVIPALPANPQEFTTAPITLTATATDATSSVANIEVLVGLQGQSLTTLGRQSGASYSAVFTPTQAGTYAVQYKASDAAGNTRTVDRTFTYVVTTAPTEKAPAPVLEVVGSAPYSGNMSVNVSGNFDAASQVDRMILQVTDSKGVVDNSTYVTTQARATFSVDTTRFANGPLKLQVIAYTKTGLRGISAEASVQVQNLTSPDFKIASPSDGVTVTTPSVPVQITLTKRSADYTITQPIQVDLLDYRGVTVASRTLDSSDRNVCSGSTESLTCNTTFDVAALPADIYTVRARTTVLVDPTGANISRPLETSSQFRHNTTSVLPPASTIRFPAITDLQKPSQIDSSSGVLISVSDNTGVNVVEARIVGPFDGTQPLTLNGTTQCDASKPVNGRTPVDVLMLNYGYNPSIAIGDVVLNNLDIDGSAYVPDNNPNERYDLRVTVQDTEGNRNIQCIPVTINRAAIRAARSSYTTNTVTSPTPPNSGTGELNYTTGTWSLGGMSNRSRVAAVLYQNSAQKNITFSNDVTGNTSVTVAFGEVGTYQIVWLIEDMTTGIVTSVGGGTVSVVRNP
ncbi:Ig-like domain-containing protein [Deinococcus aquaticus]|uniref:Ig-like domain-containing protein n=1 Tax=Deinococcus aquaticus TaxID=328692 RepID=UPI003614AED9